MPDINFGELSVTYEVVRCARRTLGVVVSPDGRVEVRAPYNVSQDSIVAFAERTKPWIFKHLTRYKQAYAPRSFVNGESLPYLGKQYKLRIISDDAATFPVLTGSSLRIYVARGLGDEVQCEAVRQALGAWYATQAQQILVARLNELAVRLGACPKAVKVKHQVCRWGSCTAQGVINLNLQLVMAPPEVIDYVLVHELCHLRVRSHQREFWEEVARYDPEYKKHRKWLRSHGHTLSFLRG